MTGDYTENSLVEQPAIALFSELGWEAANCFYESFADSPSPGSSPTGRGINLGRETSYDVVLEPKLRVALRRLNPGLADEAINFAVEELTKDRGLMSPAQANRVFKNKVNGLIVDYVGVFRDLQKALAIYGSASGGIQEGDTPIKDKEALIGLLKEAQAAATGFCTEQGIDLAQIQAADGFARIKLLDDAVEAVLVNDDTKKKYLSHADNVDQIFQAILPDPKANQFAPTRAVLAVIAQKIRSLLPPVDISGVMKAVEGLLDRSIAAQGYVIKDPAEKFGGERWVDLSQIDFKALKAQFDKGRKRMEIEKLKAAIHAKLAQMVARNKSRVDYLEKFQQLIDEYNAGSYNTELFFKKLVDFAKELNEEEKRGIAERLNEDELAIFDLLTKPEMSLTKKEKTQVKKVARELLDTLKESKLVLDWRKRQQARASVRLCIEETLDRLPRAYTPDIYHTKCEAVYQHVYDSYYGQRRSVYASMN